MNDSVWIPAKYYPDGNDSTYTDKGYDWQPAIGGGYYRKYEWVVSQNPSGFGFVLRKTGQSQLKFSTSGGPTLQDPYNPTVPVPNLFEPEVVLDLKVYVNGASLTLTDSFYKQPMGGIDAPLKIGPAT
jgi:hypothetical protein